MTPAGRGAGAPSVFGFPHAIESARKRTAVGSCRDGSSRTHRAQQGGRGDAGHGPRGTADRRAGQGTFIALLGARVSVLVATDRIAIVPSGCTEHDMIHITLFDAARGGQVAQRGFGMGKVVELCGDDIGHCLSLEKSGDDVASIVPSQLRSVL